MKQLESNDLSEISNVNKKNLDELVGLVEELVINKVRIEKMKNEFSDNTYVKILDQELRIISEIQASIKKVKLIKIKTIISSLEDLVKRCCTECNIKVDLIFDGEETEIENSFIIYVNRMLSFLIKGICEGEFPPLKNKHNKIKISNYSDGKNFTMTIESNGNSFDYEEICNKFNKKDLELIYFNEEETKRFLTSINFINNVEEMIKLKLDLICLGGNMKFESKASEYRKIIITIPQSSSIMQGLLVKSGNQIFAVPIDYIETIINKNDVEIKKSKNTEMMIYMDHVIQLISLSELLKLENDCKNPCILIISANNKKAALVVDSLLDQTDMVIKPKHSILNDIVEIKGTTILGDGLVTLVLDIPSILKDI